MPKSRTSATKRRRKPGVAARRGGTGASEQALAAFAHEIRTPLTGILACAELLATSGLGERERQWVSAIKSNAEHLNSLTGLAVDAARADAVGLPLRREAFGPRALAEAVAASMRARAEVKGLKTRLTVRGRLPAALIGDAARLRAALENLVDNAVKFTERGRVSLEVATRPAARGRVRLTFSVTDTGTGLRPAEIRRLFRPFAQANVEIVQRFGGSGLGLAFVKTVAKAMGGDLRVSSAAGRGSTFRLDAVVDAAPPAATAGRRAARGRPARARSLRILCAEDNPYGRVVLNTILSELGHRIDFVGSGEAAVEAVTRGRHDVVFLDIVLSGIDGLQAARRIRALAGPVSRIPLVGISGRAELGRRATQAGMDAFLVKPVGPSELAQVLAKVTTRAAKARR